MVCEKHGTPMSLWENDRGGQTWLCGKCSVEIGRELSRSYVIEKLEAIVSKTATDEPPVGRMLNVPDSIVKLALRQLKAKA
jgi:hypothetical protein